ncbi:unnamed protein product [Plutella xylostella]|nr:unnamed protein product [Plutella xylostella]
MNFFIMQLAIADLFVGLIYVFVDIIQKITIAWLAGEVMCKLVKFLQAVVMYASTYVLVALSIDRCDAITNPMNFSGSWNRARGLIASAWLISFIFSIPLLILYEVKEVQGKDQCWIDLGTPLRWQVWMTLVSMMIFVLPALTIAVCYAVIVLTIWTKSKAVVMSPPIQSSRRTKTLRNCQMDSDPESRRASSRGLIPRAKIKSVKMTFVIVFVFVLCWSPYIVFDLLQVYDYFPQSQTTMAVATLIQSLAPLNSAANPLICCMFSPHIYSSLRRVPPYRWLWCGRRRRARGTLRSRSDSTAHSDLLSSTHARRTHSVATTLNRTRSSSVSRLHHGNHDSRRTQLLVLTSTKD